MAEGAPGAPARRRQGRHRPQRRVVPHAERRRYLHARQVGVPLVRRLGPGLPHDRAVARGLRLRQRAAPPDAPEPLQPPQRTDAGVRVELQRREPPGPRLGDDLPLQVREEPGSGGHQVPGALVPGPDAQLQLVGEPQGPPGKERLRRRLPGPRQHRRLRPQRPAAHRWVARAGGRHGLDGLLRPVHAGDGPRAGRPRRGLRGDRLQVPRERHLDQLRDGQGRRARGRHVGRGGRLLLRRPAAAERRGVPAEGPLDGRAPAALREHRVRAGHGDAPPQADGAHRALQEAPPRGGRPRGAERRRVHRPRRAPPPLSPHQGEARAHPRLPARRERVPLRIRDSRPLALPPRAPVRLPRGGPGAPRRVPPRRLQQRDVRGELELAGADLDAGQRPDRAGPHESLRLLRRRLQGRVPDRLREPDEPLRGREGDLPAPRRASSCATRAAAGRSTAAPRSSRRTRTGATSSSSTSTSTATTGPASGPATRPAGPASSRACSTSSDA